MTLVSNDFMSLALGTDVALADAGSPTAFSAVTKTGGTIKRDAGLSTVHIPRWSKFVLASTAQCNYVLPATAGHQHTVGVNIAFASSPSADVEILAVHTAGPTYYLNLWRTSTNHLKLMYSSSVIWTSTDAMTPGTEYYIECGMDNTTTACAYTVKTYLAGNSTPIANLSYTGSFTAGTGSPAFYSFGVSHTGSCASDTFYMGRPIGQNSLAALGQYSAGSVANAGADLTNLEPYSTVVLDGSLSSGSTFLWECTSITDSLALPTIINPTSKVASFIAPPGIVGGYGTQVWFKLTVDGAVTDTVTFVINPQTEWIKQADGLWHGLRG